MILPKLMASLHSSLNHGFPGCFGFVEVFGIVLSAIDITVSLNFKIGSVEFRIKRRFGKHPTSDNLGNFRIFRAKARRTLKQNRRNSWRNFVSKLNCHTPMNKVWNIVHKIKGKNNKLCQIYTV
jgi:hypothetical protein